ncbi:(deoxy)nucleoside triphosphate pyrophosphohydrolase [Erythrobacter sp. HA6-11]
MEKNPTEMLVVAGALRAKSGLWLMHRRPAEKHHGGLWEFPGGKVEPGEAPENALIRELEEELDILIEAVDLALAGEAASPRDHVQPGIVIQLYTCGNWERVPNPQEGGSVAWFTFNEMRGLPKPPLDEALLEQLEQKHSG